MNVPRIRPHVRVALLYFVIAVLWIILSDRALGLYTDDPALLTTLSIYKGFAFIVVTAILLYYERKRSDQKMRYLAALVESSDDGITSIDSRGIVTSWNRGAEKIYGYTRAEIIGKPISILYPPDGSAELYDISERVGRGEHVEHHEAVTRAKDGTLVNVSITTSPILDHGGTVIGSSTIGRDITERKRSEERTRVQQMELYQASKLASVGVLATGIAHEINNPNNYVLLNATIISRAWNDVKPILEEYHRNNGDFMVAGLPFSTSHSKIDQLVSGIAEGAHRIQGIVQGLKEFSRQDSGDLSQVVDLNIVVQSAVLIVRSLLKQSTDYFTVELQENLPSVRGNAQQLEQVVINLITNACQALRRKEDRIVVRTRVDGDSGRISLQVIDDGVGIPPNHMASIMDPFFTTKRDRGGTGLGLSISYNIVKNHRGELHFDSVVEKGTTATVLLPTDRSDLREEDTRP